MADTPYEAYAEQTEKIGNVTLDLSLYSGTDYYSDGDIEEQILTIVKEHAPSEYNEIILEENDWAIFYHLSDIRKNIISWLPITKNDTVLEIGAGCGAVTGALAEMSKKVTCVELSLRRNLINAYRNKEEDNILLKVGNYQDIYNALDEKFDYITLIGVFEYSKLYIDKSENPFEEMLLMAKAKLSEKGKLVIAIENKFGLKYWAGCREDHAGTFYSGLEGYKNEKSAKTFSRLELEQLFEKAGFSHWDFYYPYPDYKLPMAVYSDDYLPQIGDLCNNIRNYDTSRLITFDETTVFDEIIKNNAFPFFSNSYLIVLDNSQ